MISLKTIPKKDYRRATWKNGLGYTDEIAIHPSGSTLKAGNFLWRLSSAHIDQASAFSIFPEHDRLLVILSGHGIRLYHHLDESNPEEERIELPLFSPYEFPGDIQSRCELVSGAVQDLSVFIRKGEVEATVNIVELHAGEDYSWIPTSRWNFIYAAQSDVEVQSHSGDPALKLYRGDVLTAELNEPGDRPVVLRTVEPKAHLVVIGIQA